MAQPRRRVSAGEMVEENKKMARELGASVARRLKAERRRNRRYFAALWAAVVLAGVLGVWL